jgi:hypothetical protein
VLSQVQRTRTLFGRRTLDAARQRFVAGKDELYRALDDAPLDEPGRARIREYADGFFDAIARDEAFYRPVVTRADARAYADEQRSTPICSMAGAIPVGTPISKPIEIRGGMMRVTLLDALWHWTGSNDCPEIRNSTVWIERAAVSSDFPPQASRK